MTIRINAKATPALTTTPEPTVTPEPTATPEPTSTPEPTATPVPTVTPTDRTIRISTANNADTIVFDHEYTCGINGQDFNLVVDGVQFYNTKEKIKWSIKVADEDKVRITDTTTNGMNGVKARVDSETDGFVLCAEYVRYQDWNSDVVVMTKKTEKYINIIKRIEIVDLPDEVEIGKQYQLGVNAIISGIEEDNNGNYIKKEEKIYIKNDNAGSWIDWKHVGEKDYMETDGIILKVRPGTQSGQSMVLSATLGKADKLVKNWDGVVNYLTDTKTITIK